MKPNASAHEREEIIASVAEPIIETLSAKKKPLLVNDRFGLLRFSNAIRWNRYALGGEIGQVWPEKGPYDGALIRLVHDKSAMMMTIAAVASELEKGAPLYIVGANDEGIKSVGRMLSTAFEELETLDIRKRCRIIRGFRNETVIEQSDLTDWETKREFAVFGRSQQWSSWPGLFAKGMLDSGSELLVSTLQELLASKTIRLNKPVLDFGCGIGVLSAAVLNLASEASVTAIDVDAIAVFAARQNLRGLDARNSDAWSAISGSERFGLILSNPPIHTGKSGDFRMLESLIAGAANRLLHKGVLLLVVQRQIPLQKKLSLHFKQVELVAQNTRFWVWKAS